MKIILLVFLICFVDSLHLSEPKEFLQHTRKHLHHNKQQVNHQYNWGHYNSDDQPDKNQLRDRWITNLPDNKLISQLSIPGTHDSGTFNCRSDQACDSTQTQTWGLLWQLRAGIRFLDLRLNTEKSEVQIGHGRYTFYSLQHNLRDIKSFLDSNPRQFVITALQTEKGPKKVAQVVALYDKLQIQHFQNGNSIPTVGQLRGKVFITCGDSQGCDKLFSLYMWEGIHQDIRISIQNIYDMNAFQINKKTNAVMKQALSFCDPTRMKVNFLSSNGGVLPYWLAKNDGCPNQRLDIFLRKNKFKGCLGVTIMDYPGCRLINEIIDSNWFMN